MGPEKPPWQAASVTLLRPAPLDLSLLIKANGRFPKVLVIREL